MSDRDPEPPAARFQSTRWDEVLAARDFHDPRAQAALAALCRTYWYPSTLSSGARATPPSEPKTLLKGFSPTASRNFLSGVDPARGRFRSFLLACFENYLCNERDREHRIKRGGRVAIVSIDAGDAEARYLREPAHVQTAERLYDRRWTLTVIDRALDQLERKMIAQGKGPLFVQLKSALIGANDACCYAEVAVALGMTEVAVKVSAHRMRRRLRVLIREEIGLTVADPSEVDDEVRELFATLSL